MKFRKWAKLEKKSQNSSSIKFKEIFNHAAFDPEIFRSPSIKLLAYFNRWKFALNQVCIYLSCRKSGLLLCIILVRNSWRKKYLSIWHLSIRERVRKEKAQEHLKTTELVWQGLSHMPMFSSKTFNNLTESIIHSHRRFIHVRRFTSVH